MSCGSTNPDLQHLALHLLDLQVEHGFSLTFVGPPRPQRARRLPLARVGYATPLLSPAREVVCIPRRAVGPSHSRSLRDRREPPAAVPAALGPILLPVLASRLGVGGRALAPVSPRPPSGDEMLKAAIAAIGYREDAPVLRTGHPVWDAATSNGKNASAIFVPVDTREHSSISCMDQPLLKDFHSQIHTALCE